MNIPQHIPFLLFCVFLILNVLFWGGARQQHKAWSNVPPAPTLPKAKMGGLSDSQLAYRIYGLMLQNIGSVGGRQVNLREYNYETLAKWFSIQDQLDERSNFMPLIAAHYYGAIDEGDKVKHILDYLKIVGQRPYGEKWRWLGHGVFLARHIVKDKEKALELAEALASNEDPDIGIWAKHMPALIHQSEGNKEEAYAIMMNILQDSVDEVHPNEIFFMKDYICNTIFEDDAEKEKPELCH